jgi:deazaflavin-dependent oxidoreductase (nitroreductase family)
VVDEAGHEPDPPKGQDDGLERPGPHDHRPQKWGRTRGSTWLVSRQGRQLADRGRSERGARNPAWYYNIAAHPDKVQIETPGRKVPVIAEQLHGTEREEAWRQITAAAPRFAKYQQKTDRELPIIRLMPGPG